MSTLPSLTDQPVGVALRPKALLSKSSENTVLAFAVETAAAHIANAIKDFLNIIDSPKINKN